MSCTEELLQLLSNLFAEDVVASVCEAGCTSLESCSVAATPLALAALEAKADETADGLNTAFLLFSAYLVFMMQLGFAMLTAGCVRSKNAMNILLKNVLDACVGTLGFYLLGYGFARGQDPESEPNGFIGNWDFALHATAKAHEWVHFFFNWSFCAATTTIVSGAVAERCTFNAYLAYSFFLSAFVYPVVVHWVWAADGWLSAFNTSGNGYAKILKTGAIDFSGSGVVHMVGGWAALMGALVMGPRMGRFNSCGDVNDMRGHNGTLVVMGTFLLWFGWFGFNPGSQLSIADGASAIIVARTAVTTTMSGGAAGVTMLLWKYYWTRAWDALAVCNGVLAGLVGVTAACSVIEPWAAIITGVVSAVIMSAAENFCLYKMKVDDPVSAWAMHGVVGAWGVLYVGLMAQPDYVLQVYGGYGLGDDLKEGKRYGLFYGGHAQLLLCQVIEMIVVIAWVCPLMGAFFYSFRMAGLLRVSATTEFIGLDWGKHENEGRDAVMPPPSPKAAAAAKENLP